MTDFECFQEAVAKDESYMGTLAGSMCLVLEEFYKHLKVFCGVNAGGWSQCDYWRGYG